MTTRIHRAIVRGLFDDLDLATRERLLADVDEHDIFSSAFTAAGTFTYDRSLVAFNFRYELRITTDPDDGQVAPSELQQRIEGDAMDRALSAMEAAGFVGKHLRVSAWDMADSWR